MLFYMLGGIERLKHFFMFGRHLQYVLLVLVWRVTNPWRPPSHFRTSNLSSRPTLHQAGEVGFKGRYPDDGGDEYSR
jgi:hypothetical protein